MTEKRISPLTWLQGKFASLVHTHTSSQITDLSIPTKTSDLTNDSGFLTSHQSLSGYLQTSDVKDNLTSTDTNKPLSAKQGKELKTLVDGKQATLVSGTSIKTLNNTSLLGSGNISINNITVDSSWVTNSTNPVESQLIKSALDDKISKSQTAGLMKNDGTVDTSTYLTTHQSLSNYIQKSSTTGLLKNNGEVMTGGTGSSNYAIGNHTHSAYVNPTIADNLTTNDSSQVLSAKQGKILNDLIGQAITYINQ